MIVAYAAQKSGGVEIAGMAGHSVSFLRLADCCGTQAEFALAAGVFDMAVLCPDAAERFLGEGKPFVIAGELTRNANVLVSRTDGNPINIGYTAGRPSQGESAVGVFGEGVNLIPIAPNALAYALERGVVDAIVLDVLTALKSDAELVIAPLPHERPTSVLVVSENVLGTALYNNFLDTFNGIVYNMDGETLAGIFENEENINNGKEKAVLWEELGTAIKKIPRGD
jgi:hypothetical protein